MAEQEARNKLQSLKTELEKDKVDDRKVQTLFTELKHIVADLPNASPLLQTDKISKDQVLFAREVYECGALISAKSGSISGLAGEVERLKAYYYGIHGDLPQSDKQWPLIGMYLLVLLAENRIGEFHVELELIPEKEQRNPFISYAIEIAECLMGGNYSKIKSKMSSAPHPMFVPYVQELLSSTEYRKEKLLASQEKKAKVLDHEIALESLGNFLGYAMEMERIV